MTTQQLIRRYVLLGERTFTNYFWATVVLLGGVGFFFKGICSAVGFSSDISFIPQGLLMSFYGSLAILLSLYWWFLIFWNVGAGFNEFNKKEGFIRIFRWGYPGKTRRIDFSYSLKDIEAIRVEFKQGIDSQRTIYLRIKESKSNNFSKSSQQMSGNLQSGIRKFEIPLTGVGQPLTLKEIEKQASELANYLQVSLEGF